MINSSNKMHLRKCHIAIFALSIFISSCAIHSKFPFICFKRGCVNQQFDFKGFQKRLKGEIAVIKRKNKKKKPTDSKPWPDFSSTNDSIATFRGINVDYYRYLLFFRVNRCANCFDTLLVEHTSQYRTLVETDQSRLLHMIDTISLKNIITVYVKPSNHKKDDPDYDHMEKHRKRDILKFLKVNGIKSEKIKVLQDSLFPPKL